MRTVLLRSALVAFAVSMPLWMPPRVLRAEEPAVDIVIPANTEWEIRETLRRAGAHPGITLQWDSSEKKLSSKLVLTRDVVLPADDPLPALQALLLHSDIVLVPVETPSGTIHAVMDVVTSQRVLRLRAEHVSPDDLEALDRAPGRFVHAVVPTPHLADLREARSGLVRIVTPNIGSVQEIPEARAFLVTDFAPNVANVIRSLRALDDAARVGAVPPALHAVRLAHASAREVAALLTEQLAEGPVRIVGGPQQAQPRAVDRPRVQAIVSTNTLLVSGPREAVDRVLELVATLDVAPEVPAGLHVLPLDALDPAVTAATLQALIDAAPDAWRVGGSRPPVIVGHPQAHALVVYATDAAVARIRRAIETLEAVATPEKPLEPEPRPFGDPNDPDIRRTR